MKKSIIIIIAIVAVLVAGIGGSLIYYNASLGPVDKNAKENITFTINPGEATNTVISNLKKEGLIRSDLTMKIYTKLNPGNPQAGTYVLTKAMSSKEIYKAFLDGKVTRDTVWVTFVEGKRLTYIADVIAKNFEFTKEDVLKTLDDETYVKELIGKYDCLTDDILNDKIYHPLEGYLFADTYEFDSNITIKGIIERMLDNTESKLSGFENEIKNGKYSVHQIMTMASIVELEGARSDDRKGVAGVFYNRLESGWALGSDVTTYYAVNKDFSVDLTKPDLSSCNGYNTRGTCVNGLPVGPIANPSFESLKATLNPEKHDFYFFVADKNGKTYFTKTNGEHEAKCNELRANHLWYEY